MTRKILHKESGDITKEEILNITEFFSTKDYGYYRVNSLTDLKWFNNLKTLDLSGVKLESLKGLDTLIDLQKLILSHNCITNIKPVQYLVNLKEFECLYNNIKDYSPLNSLSNLEILTIERNGIAIKDLSFLNNLTKLKKLYLEYSEISDISPLMNLKGLENLSLRGNNISDISVLKELKNLTYVNLIENKITDISVLKDLPNFDNVNLASNPISDEDYNKLYEPKVSDYFNVTSKGRIKDDMPEFTFDLYCFNYTKMDGDSFINTLTITDSSSEKVIQKISMTQLFSSLSMEYDSKDKKDLTVTLSDFNFDGYKDIILFNDTLFEDDRIFLIWNKSKQVFEADKILNNITNAEFDEENKVIYGTSRKYNVKEYFSTYKYIDEVLTPINYYSRELIGDSEKIARILEFDSIKVNLGNSICFHEKVSELNENTKKMEVERDEYVFYDMEKYLTGKKREIVIRFDASSEIGKLIESTMFYQLTLF